MAVCHFDERKNSRPNACLGQFTKGGAEKVTVVPVNWNSGSLTNKTLKLGGIVNAKFRNL
jgi:hypothetical protein